MHGVVMSTYNLKKAFQSLLFATLFAISYCSFADGKFDFKIIHDGNKENEQLAQYIEEKGTFDKIIKALNATLIIPYDIHVVLTSSDIGPFYSRKTKTITLDYNDERWSGQQYDKNYPESDKESRDFYLNNINLFSFYHELGHALIDAYGIPMVGSEEDAADSLASVMILYYFKYGPQILMDNADYYENAREAHESEENAYWDVHALNEQRYYRLICYAYAKDPNGIQERLKELDREDEDDTFAHFIAEKKDSCLWEYRDLNQSWFTILKPYFKNGEEADKAIEEVNTTDPFAASTTNSTDSSTDSSDDDDDSSSTSDDDESDE